MNHEQLKKKIFTEKHLQALVKAFNPYVMYLEYQVRSPASEYVIITFRSGSPKAINVSGDSLQYIAIDVLGKL